MRYLKNIHSKKATPQTEPIPGAKQVMNSAGGYSFAVDDWARLERFLVLGSEGGSYYAKERALTRDNAAAVLRCLWADGPRAVARIASISEEGRAPKNDSAVFALALAASHEDAATRRAALAALPRVCRIGTHLFQFASHVDGMRGWGRGLRDAVGKWYQEMPPEKLAYQAVKYQQREGWGHRDLLRLAHPKPTTEQRRTLYHWVTQGWPGVGDAPHPDAALRLVWAFERAKRAASAGEVAELIREYNLPREAVPTAFLNEPEVWRAMLLAGMPMTALIRNLATMTRAGIFEDPEMAGLVAGQVADGERLRKARVHPVALLGALRTYAGGRGVRGQNTWTPVTRIVDALDAAFYLAFRAVEPTGKRWVLALDVSGSMGCGTVAGVPGLTPRDGSAAMALVTAATEERHHVVAFGDKMVPVSISPRQRLDDVLKATGNIPFGGTDCALPMLWALKNRVEADAFVVYTDSETWYGKVHPVQALREYRERTGIPAKLIVVGMVASEFTIADPSDSGMMDVVGFDTAGPEVISGFVAGGM
jgi:60 kDa SS-A/Ro ribonucleoprotein